MNTSNITQSFGKLTIDSVTPNIFKKGVDQAQIRQTVMTVYPSARVTNSLTSGLFDSGEFNLPAGSSYSSTRVTWIPVPKGTTLVQVQAQLAKFPNAKISRIISNKLEDVLTEEQKAAVANGLTTLQQLHDKHIIKDAKGNEVTPQQFRQNFFSKTGVADTDLRIEGKQNAANVERFVTAAELVR